MMTEKAAVVFITGQSNSHAHAQYLPEQERITVPMKNVFALDREGNQSFEMQDVVWSGFTTQGKNIGEWQDYTASLAYYLATRWQKTIDGGSSTPRPVYRADVHWQSGNYQRYMESGLSENNETRHIGLGKYLPVSFC